MEVRRTRDAPGGWSCANDECDEGGFGSSAALHWHCAECEYDECEYDLCSRACVSGGAGAGGSPGANGADGVTGSGGADWSLGADDADGANSVPGSGGADGANGAAYLELHARATAELNRLPVRLSAKKWAVRMMGLEGTGLAPCRLTRRSIQALVRSKALRHEKGYAVTAAAAKAGVFIFPGEAGTLRESLEFRDAAHVQVMAR